MYVYIYLREIFDFFFSKVKMLSVGCLMFLFIGFIISFAFLCFGMSASEVLQQHARHRLAHHFQPEIAHALGPLQGSARSALLLPSALMRSLCRPAICLKLPS